MKNFRKEPPTNDFICSNQTVDRFIQCIIDVMIRCEVVQADGVFCADIFSNGEIEYFARFAISKDDHKWCSNILLSNGIFFEPFLHS